MCDRVELAVERIDNIHWRSDNRIAGRSGMNVDVEMSSLYRRDAVVVKIKGGWKRGTCYQSNVIYNREDKECYETSSRHYRQR
jgi:hypothetical protein